MKSYWPQRLNRDGIGGAKITCCRVIYLNALVHEGFFFPCIGSPQKNWDGKGNMASWRVELGRKSIIWLIMYYCHMAKLDGHSQLCSKGECKVGTRKMVEQGKWGFPSK